MGFFLFVFFLINSNKTNIPEDSVLKKYQKRFGENKTEAQM